MVKGWIWLFVAGADPGTALVEPLGVAYLRISLRIHKHGWRLKPVAGLSLESGGKYPPLKIAMRLHKFRAQGPYPVS